MAKPEFLEVKYEEIVKGKFVDWPPEEDMRHKYDDFYDWCVQHQILTIGAVIFCILLLIYSLVD
jgi:hypothetical protein